VVSAPAGSNSTTGATLPGILCVKVRRCVTDSIMMDVSKPAEVNRAVAPTADDTFTARTNR